MPAREDLPSDVVDFRMLLHRARDLRDPIGPNRDVIIGEGDDWRTRTLDAAVSCKREPLPLFEEGVPVLASGYCC